jgi:hypothetical protein
MYTSFSAASDPFKSYEWFIYQGARKKTFNNHNKDYDYDLKKGYVFGLKKTPRKIYLIDFDAPTVKFAISEKEMATIVKSSIGSTAHKGKNLNKGTGGKDKPVSNYDTSLFPEGFSIPPSKEDLRKIYNFYNKKLFNNELPKDIVFRKNTTAKKYIAQARARWRNNKYVFIMDYTPSGFSRDVPYMCNTIIHEMIHILHFKRLCLDKDVNYRNSSHGPLFVKEMEKFNRLGYTVILKGDFKHTITEVDFHVAGFQTGLSDDGKSGGHWVFFYHEQPFKKNMKTILEHVRGRSAGTEFTRMIYGVSNSSHTLMSYRLDSSLLPKKHGRIRLTSGTHPTVREMFDHTKLELDESIKRSFEGDVSAYVVSVTDRMVNHKYTSLFGFLRTAVETLGHTVPRTALYDKKSMVAFVQVVVSKDSYNYMYDAWYNVKDSDILRSPLFKDVSKVLLRNDLDGLEAVKKLRGLYEMDFEERMDVVRYGKLCLKGVGDIITITDKELLLALTKPSAK